MIVATACNASVQLQWSPSLSGYVLERKQCPDGDWHFWDGLGWSTSFGLPMSGNRFTDYDVPDGLWQYRTEKDGNYVYSNYVSVGGGKLGWSFGNYQPPIGEFGEVLTPDDLQFTYLWGIDPLASNGEVFNSEQTKFFINQAVERVARELDIVILPKTYLASSEDDDRGKVYDEQIGGNWYRPEMSRNFFKISLPKRPILEVQEAELLNITGATVINLDSWKILNKKTGSLAFFPRASGRSGVSEAHKPIGWARYGAGASYPSGYWILFKAGYSSASDIPEDLRGVIGMTAAISLLNIVGDGLIAGFSSASLSMDGLSQSFSSTQSATSAYFGARIKVYEGMIKNYFINNKLKFANFRIGSI